MEPSRFRACEENNLRASMGASPTLSPGSLLARKLARCATISFSLREKSLLIQAIGAPPDGGLDSLSVLHLCFAQMIRTSFFVACGWKLVLIGSLHPSQQLRCEPASPTLMNKPRSSTVPSGTVELAPWK